MIIVRLAGGLGNQLFQLATASYLSELYGKKVYPYSSSLSKYKVRRNADSLNLVKGSWLISPEELPDIPLAAKILGSFLVDKLRVGKFFPLMINDHSYPFRYRMMRSGLPIVLADGYFQKNFTQEIFDHFKRCSSISFLQLIPEVKSLRVDKYDAAIHVRGSDFLVPNSIHYLPLSYYAKAVEYAVSNNKTKFLIVSDDISFAIRCKLFLESRFRAQFFDVYRSQGQKCALLDFCLLSRFKTLIIGNSTFSWWAAACSSVTIDSVISPGYFTVGDTRRFRLRSEKVIALDSDYMV